MIPVAASGLVDPSPGLMIWTVLTFLLVMFFLKWKVFGRIQEALEKRRIAIAESVELAEKAREEADQVLNQYRDQLAKARGEAEGIVERARQAGNDITARMKVEADEARKRAVEQTQQQVQVEIERSIGDLRASLAEMTAQAVEKVTRGALDSSGHAALVEQAIEELDLNRLQKVGSGSGR